MLKLYDILSASTDTSLIVQEVKLPAASGPRPDHCSTDI